MITASKLEIARQCPGAFALPHVDSKNSYQDAGNERDLEYSARIVAGDIPEQLDARWPGATWRAQVRFAYDINTGIGRELPAGEGHRDYSMVRETEICGTADVVGRLDGLVIVGDKKSFDPNIPRAKVNAQLHIAALALSRAWNIDDAHVFIDHEVRALDVAELDMIDLANFGHEAKAIMDAASEGVLAFSDDERVLTLNTGSWCRWCPAFDACPKQNALALEVKSGAAANRVELLIPLRDDQSAADLMEFHERLKMLSKRLGEALAARAIEKPIRRNDGRVYGLVAGSGNEQLDGDVAYEVVRDLYDQATADKAVTREVTKKQLAEVLKAKVPKGAAAEAERKVLAEIRARGGSKKEAREKLEIYDPGDKRAIGPVGETRLLKAVP